MECSVIFLAGGQSRRMGTPKAWLEFGGRPLLSLLVERMAARFPEVLVVAAPGQDLPQSSARIVADERPGEGPLAGLAAGLRAATCPLAFAASCDAPFLSPSLAAHLVELAAGGVEIVVPEWEGRLHPLHAVYARSILPRIDAQLEAGRRRPADLFELAATRIVREAELNRLEPEGRSFLNMNTPEDYQRALELWSEP